MEPPEMVNAGELVLKRWEADWADELATAVRASLPELARFVPWAHEGYDVEAARAFLRAARDEWAAGTSFNYAVFTTVGELIGGCGLMTRMGPGVLEIGYWIRSDRAGLGNATRAARALAGVGLSMPGVDRVAIRHDRANVASGRVAAKAGFHEVDRVEGKPETSGASGVSIFWEVRG